MNTLLGTSTDRTGTVQFPGFTRAMPVAQVFYGVGWSLVFGDTSRSLDISTVLLGIVGGVLFYALARKCGAGALISAVATALLLCNPCYLFLSFSFMTEVPFLVALLASYLAYAHAIDGLRGGWLWLAGASAAAGFALRPLPRLRLQVKRRLYSLLAMINAEQSGRRR